MRKKARLTSLQTRVSELRCEGSALTSALQDCFTANLLMGLSTDPDSGDEQSLSSMSSWDAEHDDSSVTSGKRTRGDMGDESDDDTLRKSLRGELDEGESLLGVDVGDDDEMLAGEADADQDLRSSAPVLMTPELADERGLSPEELEDRRRERNRQLARQTRGRKKLFVEALARTVVRLEQRNLRVRAKLTTLLEQSMLCRGTAAGGTSAAAAAEALVPSTSSSDAARHLMEMTAASNSSGLFEAAVGSPTSSAASPRDGLGAAVAPVRVAPCASREAVLAIRGDDETRAHERLQLMPNLPAPVMPATASAPAVPTAPALSEMCAVPPMLSTSLGTKHGVLSSGFPTYAPSMAVY